MEIYGLQIGVGQTLGRTTQPYVWVQWVRISVHVCAFKATHRSVTLKDIIDDLAD